MNGSPRKHMQPPPLHAQQRSARRTTTQCPADEPTIEVLSAKPPTRLVQGTSNNNNNSTDDARDDDCDDISETLEWRRRSSAHPLSARSAPGSAREHHPTDRASRSPSDAATSSAAAAAARQPMKKSRLQYALGDAQQYLRSELVAQEDNETAHADAETSEVLLQQIYSRQARQQNALASSTMLLTSSGFASHEQLVIARDATQRIVANMHAVAAMDARSIDRVLLALKTELPCSIENPAKRHEPDAQCWYAFGKVVGKGTFGRVASARHRLSETQVAIKSYFREPGATVCCRAPRAASSAHTSRTPSASSHASLNASRQKLEDADALDWRRVRQEVKMMTALKPHASIIRFIEAFETPTQMHVVMEFVAGENLCDFMRSEQRARRSSCGSNSNSDATLKLSEATARAIFTQLCAAVASLHDQNVIHRDLKLENVLVDKRGRTKLIDFGFSQFDYTSRRSSRGTTSLSTSLSPVTAAGAGAGAGTTKNFCGTPSYMAPEVVASKSYDGKCVDVWSLGVVLYVLLCGKFPFQGQSFHQLYQNIRSSPCTFVGADRSVSSDAQALIRSMLAVDPAKRPRVRDILVHPWMTSTNDAHAQRRARDDSSFFTAFLQWEEPHMQVCAALEQTHGVSAAALMEAVRDMRQNGAAAFVRLMVLAAEKRCALALSNLARVGAGSMSSRRNDSESIEPNALAGADADAMSHKQRLENLIGLVKASLTI